ncbi:glycosyltransferase [Anabaena sp. UHCC 0204]|uniref:glycosyltransferase n=1 Tax=Anabaena sp. UHCC 0204 TaxID=2590009 RepID=UPI001445D32E|nr:glycosyltransferase [Anabaena sp. UHCC 0204]MTJ08638.1 glycosyltransferase [Anabaena sp. UHCC 0204]
MNLKNNGNGRILILIPVFNDWESVIILLGLLDDFLFDKNISVEVLILNDSSTRLIPFNSLSLINLKLICKVNILHLRRNLGHQRAIAIGLAYVAETINCQAVLIMDSDGEDTPQDALELIEKCNVENYNKIVFAKRKERSEGFLFILFYTIYRLLYKVLTGCQISFGNFSIIPYDLLQKIVVVSEIWNHYAAGVMKSKLPYTTIPTKRGKRIAGKSNMNFVMLVTHGLSAISVYGETIGVRLLIGSCIIMFGTMFFICTILFVKLATELAIPGWASSMVLLAIIILIQTILGSLLFSFIALNGRNNINFLPNRDYYYFIQSIQKILPKQAM